jgi:tetratricopeptide (TPR) repeat protein
VAKLPGQSLRAFERKAMEAYEARDYAAALAYNAVLIEADSHRVDALFMGGEAARHLRAFDLAEKFLEKIPDSLKSGFYAASDFRLASTKKGLEKYDEAARYYRKYLDTHPDTNDLFVKRAKEEIEYCAWAMEKQQLPSRIEVVHLGENVNTVYSDFAPLRFADKLYFTSAYLADTAAAPVNRIYAAIQDDPARLIAENTDDPALHSSHISLTADGKRMYYTVCSDKPYLHEYRCELYYRDRNYEGSWGTPRQLPRHINLDSFTATQPAAGYDKYLNKNVLFFASDRPGGKGNLDLWCTVIEKDGTFGKPFPLPFNTTQDDITPFFHQPSQTLFFSSGGLENMGGYDIFHSEKTGPNTWAEPSNMGPPLNSSYDDLYYTFHSGTKKGYFASNRPGSRCADPASGCKCNDIYEAKILVDLDARTYNVLDSTELSDVRVELFDLDAQATDTIYINPTGNKFYFSLDLEKNYRITASLDGFLPDTAIVSTEGVNSFKTFDRKLYLLPGVVLVARTYNALDSMALNGTLISLESPPNGLVKSQQNDETSNTAFFPLAFGKNYQVGATKPNWSDDTAFLDTRSLMKPDTIFRHLYLSPFSGLPLVLYFDNDKPRYVQRPDTTTSLTYAATYRAFLERKDRFVEGYTAGLQGDERSQATQEILDFFEKEVVANHERLQNYCALIERYLAAGHRIEILVSGFASPLAPADYNRRLTGRRVSSIINHLRNWNNGVLSPYFDRGLLVVNLDPKGEQTGVSDNPQDRRQSEFSPAASRLRRVTITEIRAFEK